MNLTTKPIGLPFRQIAIAFARWRLRRAERHCQMCAEVELQRAREANLNAAYYQKQAALARIAARSLS